MFNDYTPSVVFRDQFITTLGYFLLSTLGVRKSTISQRMRSSACLLICLCQRHNVDISLVAFIDPHYSDDIVDAT